MANSYRLGVPARKTVLAKADVADESYQRLLPPPDPKGGVKVCAFHLCQIRLHAMLGKLLKPAV